MIRPRSHRTSMLRGAGSRSLRRASRDRLRSRTDERNCRRINVVDVPRGVLRVRDAVGRHCHIGYVWALPEGGYEFGLFWAVMIATFAVLGGGLYSLDRKLWRS